WHDDHHPLKCGYHKEAGKLTVYGDHKHGTLHFEFALPEDVDLEKCAATYEKGVFKAHFPRTSLNWVTWLV
ncbi:hypothetical protein IWQ60_011521, partial [Tieghemiomyces parasiticus]